MRQSGHKRYKDLPEDEKKKFVDYKISIIKREKAAYYIYKKIHLKN